MTGLGTLRKFIRPREGAERCESCGVSLPVPHPHQFHPAARQVRCSCEYCAKAAGPWREIPREVRALPAFRMSDAQWDQLMIPISLAFFSWSSPAARVVAFYPGPAGAAESMMPLDTWEEITQANPELRGMRADVEALLVNRVGSAREYFIVPVDECYRLVGMIRLHWRGLSGGAFVWGEIVRFFDELRGKELLP